MQTFITAITLWFLLCAVPAAKSAAQPAATIAVAANFLGALSDIVAAYESESGAKLQTVSSSTGKLYAQISNGAPYDQDQRYDLACDVACSPRLRSSHVHLRAITE